MIKFLLFFLQLLFFAVTAIGQSPDMLGIRKYCDQNQGKIIGEFRRFLSLPNLAKDTENIRNNGGFIMQMMKQRGIANVQLLDGATPAVPPAVFGEVTVPGAKETLI